MKRGLRFSRYLLPAVFLCYSLVANINFVRVGDFASDFSGASFFKGTIATKIDTVYKTTLPHRDVSIGLIGAARYLLIGEGRLGVIAGQDGWLFTGEEARKMPEHLADANSEMEGIFEELASHGTKLIVLPLPGKLDVYGHKTSQDIGSPIRNTYLRFVANLSESGIPTVDARGVLEGGQSEAEMFLETDTHWSPAGAAKVADFVALSETIPVGKRNYRARRGKAETFNGDLVSFVTSARLAPYIGLKPETVRPFDAVPEKQSVVDIFDAVASDTVLIGTSYSANPNWSFAESLKIALSRDVLNLAEEGQGPVAPMRAYLKSQGFQNSPPRYLIWEFPVRYLSQPDLWRTDDQSSGGA